MARKYHKGKFFPLNPKKYVGDINEIVYRSSWELSAMRRFDTRSDFMQWSSEEIIIYYVSPKDGKAHRYFPDFKVKKREKDGSMTTYIVEIKPKGQCRPPTRPHRITKSYIEARKTWEINQAKWEAARKFCADRGWKFLVLTEDELGLA